VATILVVAGAILLSVLCYLGTPPLFIAYGVAMTGIGMLTLTGNTISMDVFGPVADNANGIGEMGMIRMKWSAAARAATAGAPDPGGPGCGRQHDKAETKGSPSALRSSLRCRSSPASSPSSPSAAKTGSVR